MDIDDHMIKRIAQQLEECAWVLRKLPSGLRMSYGNFWPEYHYSRDDLADHEKRRSRVQPTPEQIDRMHATLAWFTQIDEDYRRIVWLRADRCSWKEIAREVGKPPTTIRRCWAKALSQIATSRHRITQETTSRRFL